MSSGVGTIDDRAGFRFRRRLRLGLGGLREGAPGEEAGRKADGDDSIHSCLCEARDRLKLVGHVLERFQPVDLLTCEPGHRSRGRPQQTKAAAHSSKLRGAGTVCQA